jgi:hypothetical protein
MPNIGLAELAIILVALAPLILLTVIAVAILSGKRNASRRRGDQLDRIERRLIELEERIERGPQ